MKLSLLARFKHIAVLKQEIMVMKRIALATAVAFFASVITAAAMPGIPMVNGMSETGVVQVKAKKKMRHMSGKHMKGDKDMRGDKETKGMDGMKGGGMKGMKGM